MRVLHVLDSFEAGGAQRVVLQLSAWMRDHGVQSGLFGQPGELEAAVPKGIPVFLTPGNFAAATARLLAVCRDFAPDVLHAHQRREALMSAIVGRLLGIPVVEHAHTFLPGRQLAAFSFRSARIFAVSDQVGQMVTGTYRRPAERLVVIGNTAASTSSFAPMTREPLEGRPLRIIGIGRLVEQKNPQRFVRVLAAASQRMPVTGVWFGDGPLRAEVEELARVFDAPVTFAGQSESITAEIDDSDALLMTSRWEGTPLAVLEAFARRRPVVATAAVGSSGVLGEGRALSIADDCSDEEFADALVGSLADEVATEARVTAAYDYSLDVASPDRVFGPVLVGYLHVTGRGRQRHGEASAPQIGNTQKEAQWTRK